MVFLDIYTQFFIMRFKVIRIKSSILNRFRIIKIRAPGVIGRLVTG
jgi:hypothetical protein